MKTFYRILHKRSSPEGLTEKNWEGLLVKAFPKRVSSFFRVLPVCTGDAKGDRQLFKAVGALSAARECRRKRIRVANRGKQVTPAWTRR